MTRRPLPLPSRADAVRSAIANTRLAGLTVSAETLALLRRWEIGEIDDAEMLRIGQEQVAAMIRRPPSSD